MEFYEDEPRNRLVKGFAVLIVVAIVIAFLVSCTGSRTVTASVAFENVGVYTIATTANNFVNMSRVNNTMKVTVNEDGAYPFLIKSDDGNDYNFVLTYDQGVISAKADDGLAYTVSVS